MKFDSVTADIVRQLEEGVKPWKQAWATKGSLIPFNASTSETYRGVNILFLWSAVMKRGYPTMGFMGFKQAHSLGAHVRKGEKATQIVYFNHLVDEETEKKIPYSRLLNVFNVAQLENLPPEMVTEPQPIPESERMSAFNEILNASEIPYRLGCPKPCYIPSVDRVEMPNFESFTSPNAQVKEADWISTFSHELLHATSHPKRLDRKFDGEDAYGVEECCVELGAAFMCAALGVSYNDAQSPAYIGGWLKVIKRDARALFAIASQASKAADWLLERPHVVTAATPEAERQLQLA